MNLVFFGDSITDCGRDRTDETSLGNGYVQILADKLRLFYPDTDIKIINAGVSGDEVEDLLSRVQKDVIDRKPDAVVMMIGINNTIHQFEIGKTLDFEKFERDLTALLTRLKSEGITVLFLEPFLLPAPDKLRMRKTFDKELEIINRVALSVVDEFVAYDEMFNGLAQGTPYREYSEDGVHPTYAGSHIIADQAITAIRKHLL